MLQIEIKKLKPGSVFRLRRQGPLYMRASANRYKKSQHYKMIPATDMAFCINGKFAANAPVIYLKPDQIVQID